MLNAGAGLLVHETKEVYEAGAAADWAGAWERWVKLVISVILLTQLASAPYVFLSLAGSPASALAQAGALEPERVWVQMVPAPFALPPSQRL